MNGNETLAAGATDRIRAAVDEVRVELEDAQRAFRPLASGFEGWAVIRVELDELFGEIKRREQDPRAIRKAACQVAAMCARHLLDVNGRDTEDVFGDLRALLQDLLPRASAHEAYGYLHMQLSDAWRDHRNAMVEAVRLMLLTDGKPQAPATAQRA